MFATEICRVGGFDIKGRRVLGMNSGEESESARRVQWDQGSVSGCWGSGPLPLPLNTVVWPVEMAQVWWGKTGRYVGKANHLAPS